MVIPAETGPSFAPNRTTLPPQACSGDDEIGTVDHAMAWFKTPPRISKSYISPVVTHSLWFRCRLDTQTLSKGFITLSNNICSCNIISVFPGKIRTFPKKLAAQSRAAAAMHGPEIFMKSPITDKYISGGSGEDRHASPLEIIEATIPMGIAENRLSGEFYGSGTDVSHYRGRPACPP